MVAYSRWTSLCHESNLVNHDSPHEIELPGTQHGFSFIQVRVISMLDHNSS